MLPKGLDREKGDPKPNAGPIRTKTEEKTPSYPRANDSKKRTHSYN